MLASVADGRAYPNFRYSDMDRLTKFWKRHPGVGRNVSRLVNSKAYHTNLASRFAWSDRRVRSDLHRKTSLSECIFVDENPLDRDWILRILQGQSDSLSYRGKIREALSIKECGLEERC
jgi:hypothetical protein